jgi:hypothetical protein
LCGVVRHTGERTTTSRPPRGHKRAFARAAAPLFASGGRQRGAANLLQPSSPKVCATGVESKLPKKGHTHNRGSATKGGQFLCMSKGAEATTNETVFKGRARQRGSSRVGLVSSGGARAQARAMPKGKKGGMGAGVPKQKKKQNNLQRRIENTKQKRRACVRIAWQCKEKGRDRISQRGAALGKKEGCGLGRARPDMYKEKKKRCAAAPRSQRPFPFTRAPPRRRRRSPRATWRWRCATASARPT